jgi:porin
MRIQFTWTLMATRTSALAIGLLAAFSLPAVAQTEETPDYANMSLSGDWGGERSAAWRAGWAWDATLKIDALRHRGGATAGGGIMSNLDLRLKADLAKTAGWAGATAYLHVLDNRGASINARHTSSLMGVSNIEVPVPTTTIFHAWLQQNFFDDQFSLLAGLYPIDSEFFVVESASLLIHPAFGALADLALTHGPSIFNHSSFGLRAKWLSADRTLYAMGALLDGFPASDPAHPTFTPNRFASGHGAFAIAEMGWLPEERGHVFEPTEPVNILQTPALVGHEKYTGTSKYAFGLWRYGNRVPDQFDVDADGDPLQSRSQGAYLLAERTLFDLGAAGRDFTAFARYSTSDGDSTALDKMWNIGARLRGPIASRPHDALVVGWTRSHLAPKYRAAQAAAGADTADSEEMLEITWRMALTPWFALQPVVQAIRHPGGAAGAPRATILGARIEIAI